MSQASWRAEYTHSFITLPLQIFVTGWNSDQYSVLKILLVLSIYKYYGGIQYVQLREEGERRTAFVMIFIFGGHPNS